MWRLNNILTYLSLPESPLKTNNGWAAQLESYRNGGQDPGQNKLARGFASPTAHLHVPRIGFPTWRKPASTDCVVHQPCCSHRGHQTNWSKNTNWPQKRDFIRKYDLVWKHDLVWKSELVWKYELVWKHELVCTRFFLKVRPGLKTRNGLKKRIGLKIRTGLTTRNGLKTLCGLKIRNGLKQKAGKRKENILSKPERIGFRRTFPYITVDTKTQHIILFALRCLDV